MEQPVSVSQNSRSPRVAKAVAMSRFIEAVLEHLGSRPIVEITDQLIADTAGINRASLYRYFATRDQLFDAVLSQLTDEWMQVATSNPPPKIDGGDVMGLPKLFSSLMHSTQRIFEVIAYLTGSGYRSAQIETSLATVVGEWVKIMTSYGIEPRVANAFAIKNLALNFTQVAVRPVFDIQPGAIADVAALTLVELTNHQLSTEKLGWGDN